MLPAIKRGLQKQGMPVHSMSAILPGFHAQQSDYKISPYDQHPNERVHELIAEYVANHIAIPVSRMTVAALPALSQ